MKQYPLNSFIPSSDTAWLQSAWLAGAACLYDSALRSSPLNLLGRFIQLSTTRLVMRRRRISFGPGRMMFDK